MPLGLLDLPDELLILIAAHVDRLVDLVRGWELTCRRLRAVALDDCVWRHRFQAFALSPRWPSRADGDVDAGGGDGAESDRQRFIAAYSHQLVAFGNWVMFQARGGRIMWWNTRWARKRSGGTPYDAAILFLAPNIVALRTTSCAVVRELRSGDTVRIPLDALADDYGDRLISARESEFLAACDDTAPSECAFRPEPFRLPADGRALQLPGGYEVASGIVSIPEHYPEPVLVIGHPTLLPYVFLLPKSSDGWLEVVPATTDLQLYGSGAPDDTHALTVFNWTFLLDWALRALSVSNRTVPPSEHRALQSLRTTHVVGDA